MPSISRDGRTLAFVAISRGATTRTPAQNDKPFMFPSPQHSSNLEIRVKDLETGREAAISGGEPFPFRPEISPDGTLIAYTADRPGQVYMAWVEHGTPRVIVESR